LEGGTSDTFQKWIVKTGLRALLSFMQQNEMIKRKKKIKKAPFQIVVHKTEWIRAERGGLLELKIQPGKVIYRGDPIARISNPLGRDAHLVPSPITGVVLGVTTSPVVNPGTAIANVAELRKTLPTVERYIVRGKLRTI
jgi:uncharacterized protein